MSQWWITEAGQRPLGPFDEVTVARKLSSGEVPAASLVCIVGGDRWQPVSEVPAFAAALQGGLQRFDESAEDKTIVDDMPLALQDDLDEETAVDRRATGKPRA
jgi:hypothetical protein